MDRKDSPARTEQNPTKYDPPTLHEIGDAADVVLGVPYGGFDGGDELSEVGFEFEPDPIEE